MLGQFYSLFAVMIFFVAGGDAIMLQGLAASYRGAAHRRHARHGQLSANLVPLAGQVFVIGIEIAAPVIIALIVTDAAFGLIARAVPQMNVFFVGLPAKIMLGFAVISASLPFVAARISDQLEASVFTALRVLHAACESVQQTTARPATGRWWLIGEPTTRPRRQPRNGATRPARRVRSAVRPTSTRPSCCWPASRRSRSPRRRSGRAPPT